MVCPVNPKYVPISPGECDSSQVPPTSGKKPRPTSGIASFVLSVTTRWLECADSPTPPPITMPSMKDDIGLREFLDPGVEDVFVAPQDLAEIALHLGAFPERADVAAGAEAALAGAFQQDHGNSGIGLECIERLVDVAKHLQRHGIDRLRPVQSDDAAGALAPRDQVAFDERGSGGRRHRAPSISLRDTISRMISLVPSRIWCTRRSRTIFSMPYSLR